LKGVAIGNGWVDPFYQFPAHNEYAIENNIINGGRGFLLSLGFQLCQYMMLTEIPFLGQAVCYLSELAISGNPIYPKFNYFDIRGTCDNPFTCYDTNGLSLYINSAKFRQIVGGYGEWSECDSTVRALSLYFA